MTIEEAYKTGDVDFRAQLSKIKELGDFDALMIPANYKRGGPDRKAGQSAGNRCSVFGRGCVDDAGPV